MPAASPWGCANLDESAPGIIATQSTHKQLASFSQASQIHVKDSHIRGQRRRVEHRRFNESFLQHASTSPFYPLFASLDVGAQMMKGRSGEVLWDDTIRLGIELRKKLRAIRQEFERRESGPGAPLVLRSVRAGSSCGSPDAAQRRRRARGAVGERRHRCAGEPRPILGTDAGRALARLHRACRPASPSPIPNKLTLLTPGFNRATGEYEAHGIPAPVVAQYLRENRVVPEKIRSQFAAVSAHAGRGGEQGRHAGEHARRLQAAARRQCAARRRDPEICRRRSRKRYRGVRLRDLCQEMHAFFRAENVSALQKAQFTPEHLPEPAMTPHEAARHLVRNNVDYLPIDRDRRPHRVNAFRRLPARHRDHRAGRTA